MTNAYKNRLLMLGAATAVLGVSGCKKYPEGPAFSLKSKKARLSGEWEMTEGKFLDEVDEDVFFEFEKDGDFTVTLSYSYPGYSYSYSIEGEWELSGDKEELEIELVVGSKVDFEILRLTNRELILEGEEGKYFEGEHEFEKQ